MSYYKEVTVNAVIEQKISSNQNIKKILNYPLHCRHDAQIAMKFTTRKIFAPINNFLWLAFQPGTHSSLGKYTTLNLLWGQIPTQVRIESRLIRVEARSNLIKNQSKWQKNFENSRETYVQNRVPYKLIKEDSLIKDYNYK